ncbi:hypothetical protein CVT25_010155 [Psilocybe cyanescens]|uniref:Translation machinery-associated protein 16 n=1 Tax=Psilocybe cyanescens TaxID=93625 RepID=A0A409XJ59_PSICY|nr:hypothetical protein CVT25_010155 [Psilocybe cyanescens]
MAPANTTKAAAAATKVKKEKLFHPASRKAGQLARNALRKGKLGNLTTKRNQKHHSLGMYTISCFQITSIELSTVDLYGFFYHAVPEEGVLTLEELHHIISDVWLTRFDEELESERSARRKGRPKSAKEIKLEELKLREAEIYRTGMEVIDLTHPPTVELFRRWDQKEVAFIQLLRFIRIFSTDHQLALVSRPGKHLSITGSTTVPDNDAMDITGESDIISA